MGEQFDPDKVWGIGRWVTHDCIVNGVLTPNVTHSKEFHRRKGQLHRQGPVIRRAMGSGREEAS